MGFHALHTLNHLCFVLTPVCCAEVTLKYLMFTDCTMYFHVEAFAYALLCAWNVPVS